MANVDSVRRRPSRPLIDIATVAVLSLNGLWIAIKIVQGLIK